MTSFVLKGYQRNSSLIVLTFFISVSLAIIFNKLGPLMALGALCLLLVTYLFIVKFEIMFLAFIILRPVFDMATDRGLGEKYSRINLAAVVSMLFIVAALFFILRRKKNINLPLEIKFFSIFLVFALISTIFNFNIVKNGGLFQFFRLVTILFVMLIILQEFNTLEKIEKLIKIIMYSMIIPVLYGIVQIFTGINTISGDGFVRISGGFPHANSFAVYLSIFIIMIYAIVMLKDKMDSRNKILLWIVEIVLMICLLLTYGRGTMLSLGITILLITLFYVRKKTFLFFGVPILISIILCFYMSGSSFFNLGERFQDVKVWESTDILHNNQNSLGWRILYWKQLLKTAFDSPIVGCGLGSVTKIGYIDAHNNYVQLFVETGLGALFYLIVIFSFLIKAIRGIYLKDNLNKFFFVGTTGMVVFYLIVSFSAHLIRNTAFQMYFFSFLTLMICHQRLAVRKSLTGKNNG